jgi:hypothetical protein
MIADTVKLSSMDIAVSLLKMLLSLNFQWRVARLDEAVSQFVARKVSDIQWNEPKRKKTSLATLGTKSSCIHGPYQLLCTAVAIWTDLEPLPEEPRR